VILLWYVFRKDDRAPSPLNLCTFAHSSQISQSLVISRFLEESVAGCILEVTVNQMQQLEKRALPNNSTTTNGPITPFDHPLQPLHNTGIVVETK
jgi:hypothetical protein